MGQRRSSSSPFMSIFNVFRSGGRKEECYSSVGEGTVQGCNSRIDEGTAAMQGWTKVRKSDEDKGQWGPSEPDIDIKAAAFIARYKKKVTESEFHQIHFDQKKKEVHQIPAST